MAESGDPEELMPARAAQAMLGISNKKLAELLKSGTLPSVPDPLDKRLKLVRRGDVEQLLARSIKKVAA